MNIYEKLKNCSEEDVFDLVTSDPDLETDGAWGIIERLKVAFPHLESLHSIVDEGDRIKAIDEKIEGETILFVTQSHGTSDLLFKIEKDFVVDNNIKSYGLVYSANYIPVSLLPNLWSTPGDILDIAIQNYACTAVKDSKFRVGKLIKKFNDLEVYLLKHWWLISAVLVLFIVLVIIRS